MRIENRALRGQVIREWAFGGRWILDFYVPTIRLGIEVDGITHLSPETRRKDRAKEYALTILDIDLLRLDHDEILYDEKRAIDRLVDALASAREKCAATPKPLRKKAQKFPPVPVPSAARQPRTVSDPYRGGWTSISQGERAVGDRQSRRYIDEGIGGSREDNKRMRGRDFADMKKRARE